MDTIFQKITEWLKEMLVSGIMESLSGMFDSVNQQVSDVAAQVGTSPVNFSPGVFAMIRNVSESVIIPIAGLILTFIACYELIQLIIDHNNLANFETWIFFKWVFKTFVAVMLITNTFNITMAVFDVAQHVISSAGGVIGGSTAVDGSSLSSMQATLEGMEIGPLIGTYMEILILGIGIHNMSAYIRKMALDGLCICLDLKDIRSLTEQVARCGNNLNQYAKRANENGSIYAADIMDLQEQFQEILDTERSIFLKLAALK